MSTRPFARRPYEPEELIVMPKASVATRLVVAKSTASFRGAFVTDVHDREVFVESTYENGLRAILETNRGVRRYVEQPPAVRYVDDDGVGHRLTFDFLVHMCCGARIAYAVKAAVRVGPTGIERKLELIAEQVGRRFADEYVLVTEQDLSPSRVANATLIAHSRRVRDDDEVVRLAAFVRGGRGGMTVAALLEASGLGLDGFIAAVNLLDDGVLSQSTPGRIGLETRVRPNPTKH